MKKKRWLWWSLKLLHPKNLAREVHVYGYHFSWKSHVALMLGALAGISSVGILFQLKPIHFFVVISAVVLALPVLVLDMYKKMYEQKRFSDVTSYMEQMLYSFQKTGKVASALKESREIFGDGRMRSCIDAAILHMKLGNPRSVRGVIGESLRMIEVHYGCKKLSVVHKLIASAEEYGGVVEDSILLVLEDIERWKKRGYRLHAEKKKCHADNVISIVVATLLCAVALYVLAAMRTMFGAAGEVDIFVIPTIQISSVGFILILLHIFVKSERKLTDDWLREEGLYEPEYILRSYDAVVHYGEGKVKRKSARIAGGLFLIAILFLAAEKRIVGIAGLAAAVFFLLQHKAGYQLAKKDVTRALYLALPEWLLGMALLLQNNNVQVALAKSISEAPAVLKRELGMLEERLGRSPGSLQSYTAFCGAFDLPEMTSCMRMLHALSESGTGNVGAQMSHLLERVEQMQDMADEIQNENIAFRMKLIFSYPVVAATGKLLADLTVGMAVMMQILGSVGGV